MTPDCDTCEHEWLVDPDWGRTGVVVRERCSCCGSSRYRVIEPSSQVQETHSAPDLSRSRAPQGVV